ncbi:S41 family peptidase [Bacillus massiliglaciei]|uniref:S41 family peptidase n=1 Tax=Bacillus massiliglaciei TaxID=1816693 RepID=UPI0038994AE1
MRKWTIPLSVAVSLTVGAAGGMYWTASEQDEKQTEQKQTEGEAEWGKMEQAYNLIKNQYVEKVEDKQLMEGAIQGMLSTLKDPYSVYMNKETAKQFNEALDSSFEGIGTEIGMEDDKIIVVSPYKDSPAEKAGLKPKDQILKIDGKSIEGLDLYETRLKIRGEKGTAVELEIKRSGVADPIVMKIMREEIPLQSVFSSLKKEAGENIGYIELTSFSENTAADFKKELTNLEKEGIDGLVIDVRGNPGGLLSSVQEILSELIPKDKPYLQIAERNGNTQSFYTELKQKKEYPIAVLTDKGSASASEILAGALQEAGGYPLIGEKTFGKGTVQQAMPLGDGSNLKLTLYKWLTPDGHWIHKKGIKPDLSVKQPSYFNVHQLTVEKAMQRDMNDDQVKYAQDMLRGLGFETGRTDGYFDKQTEFAVKAFQKREKLKETGKLDEKTASRLQADVLEKIQDESNDVQLLTALKYIAGKE